METPSPTQSTTIAVRFAEGEIDRCSRQSLKVWPKSGLSSIHCSRRGLLRWNDQSATRKKTVDGITGTKSPM